MRQLPHQLPLSRGTARAEGKPFGAQGEIRNFFEERVAHWDDKAKGAAPKWDAEVVSTAAALAINDAATTGKLHPLTRKALDRIWTVQKSDGGFDWLKCGWPPYEYDDYHGHSSPRSRRDRLPKVMRNPRPHSRAWLGSARILRAMLLPNFTMRRCSSGPRSGSTAS